MTEAERERIAALPYRPCVGVVLVNGEGRIFGGQRIDNPGPAWQMPQGGIDDGETPQAAGLRELREETGVAPERVRLLSESETWLHYDLPLDLVPKLWKGRFRGQKQKWLALRFTGTDADIDIVQAQPEFSAWGWLTPGELIEAAVPFKRHVYEAVFDEFRPILAG
jgi:putative (di)nucleoside polyphosphate hydrolase